MSEVTRILSAIEQGDPHAADQLLPLVYDELRKLAAQKLAHEAPGQTLQATALVHEAYVRLVRAKNSNRTGETGQPPAFFLPPPPGHAPHLARPRPRQAPPQARWWLATPPPGPD